VRAFSEDHQAQLTFKKIKHDLPFPSLPPQKYRALPLFLVFEASSEAQPHLSLTASPKFLFFVFYFPGFHVRSLPPGQGRRSVEGTRLGWADGRRSSREGSGAGGEDFAFIIPPFPQRESGFSGTNTCDQAVFAGTRPWWPALSTGLSHQGTARGS